MFSGAAAGLRRPSLSVLVLLCEGLFLVCGVKGYFSHFARGEPFFKPPLVEGGMSPEVTGGMLPTACGWRGAKHRPGSVHSYSFPQCERQHWFSIGLPEKRTYLSNSKFIYFLLCRSGRGRPPLFFSRKEKGERNDKGLRPLTPSRSTYTSDSPSAQSPREAYLVALLRRQQKAAWCFPRKLCSRSDRYVS